MTTRMPPHPLWPYLPAERRNKRALMALNMQRFRAWMRQRRQSIALTIALYLLLWLIPLAYNQLLITSFALLPLLLVPPVGVLIYWLVWHEFHG